MLAVSIRGQGKGSSIYTNIHVSQSSEKGEAVRQKALSPFSLHAPHIQPTSAHISKLIIQINGKEGDHYSSSIIQREV